MAFDFRKSAMVETTLSPVMVNRDRLDRKDVVDRDLTIVEFGFAPAFDSKTGERIVNEETGEAEVFAVVVFSEFPNKYYNGGAILTRICKAWADGFATAEDASNELKETGGVKVHLYLGKTKNGREQVKVKII